MNARKTAHPATPPASSPVLDRIFAVAPPRAAENDTNYACASPIVRRRERQRRRDAR